MSENEVIIYRHKTNKNIYLIRNWNICGGGPDTEWFEATENIYKAIENSKVTDYHKGIDKAFKERAYPDKLIAKIIVKKDFDFDGYKGTLAKELEFKVCDFEKVTLVIKEDFKKGCIEI